MKKILVGIIIVLPLLILGLTGCSPNDLSSSFYAPNLYPNANNTGNVGGNTSQWRSGYFQNLYADGAPVLPPAYGQLYTENVSSSLTVVTAMTWYVYTFNNIGLNSLTTLNTNSITINSAGTYLVSEQASSSSNSGVSRIDHWHVFINGNNSSMISGAQKLALNQTGVVSSSGIIRLKVGDVIDLRVTSTTNGDVITTDHASLVVTRIGQ